MWQGQTVADKDSVSRHAEPKGKVNTDSSVQKGCSTWNVLVSGAIEI